MSDAVYMVDHVRKQTGATFNEAVAGLDRTQGDVQAAIELLKNRASKPEIINVRAQDLRKALTDIIRRGNASRIVIRNEKRVIASIPVTAGLVGVILAPYISFLGGIALLASPLVLEIHRPPGI